MAFTQTQVRKLAGKLPERFVKTRSERGMTLSYVEGWHVIDEANRVFGFDGWDRETVSAECVWQDGRISPKACSYAVRVRIRVRAGKTIVSREGSGFGHGTGATLGEAHESALKEAETDATKRALITFGNRFGLALYDKEQAGVQRAKAAAPAAIVWTLLTGKAPPRICETPQRFCSAAKEALRQAHSFAELEALWTGNAPTVGQLRAVQPQLRTRNGVHYADLLEGLYRQQRNRLEQPPESNEVPIAPMAAAPSAQLVVDTALSQPKAETAEVQPDEQAAQRSGAPLESSEEKSFREASTLRRMRDAEHLRYVASLPCLVCGRSGSQAHHLRFIQPRSLGSKPGDQWTVPLCPIHHRSLHDVGRENEWWQAKGIDAKADAERLWRTTHAPTAEAVGTTGHGEPQGLSAEPNDGGSTDRELGGALKPVTIQTPTEPPTDDDGQPIPINLRVDVTS